MPAQRSRSSSSSASASSSTGNGTQAGNSNSTGSVPAVGAGTASRMGGSKEDDFGARLGQRRREREERAVQELEHINGVLAHLTDQPNSPTGTRTKKLFDGTESVSTAPTTASTVSGGPPARGSVPGGSVSLDAITTKSLASMTEITYWTLEKKRMETQLKKLRLKMAGGTEGESKKLTTTAWKSQSKARAETATLPGSDSTVKTTPSVTSTSLSPQLQQDSAVLPPTTLRTSKSLGYQPRPNRGLETNMSQKFSVETMGVDERNRTLNRQDPQGSAQRLRPSLLDTRRQRNASRTLVKDAESESQASWRPVQNLSIRPGWESIMSGMTDSLATEGPNVAREEEDVKPYVEEKEKKGFATIAEDTRDVAGPSEEVAQKEESSEGKTKTEETELSLQEQPSRTLDKWCDLLRTDKVNKMPNEDFPSLKGIVGDEGLKKVAQAVLRRKEGIVRSLTSLDFSGCDIGDEGVRCLLMELRQTLFHNPQSFLRCRLRKIDLSNNPRITAKVGLDLLDIVHMIGSIKEFHVDNQDASTQRLIACATRVRLQVEKEQVERRRQQLLEQKPEKGNQDQGTPKPLAEGEVEASEEVAIAAGQADRRRRREDARPRRATKIASPTSTTDYQVDLALLWQNPVASLTSLPLVTQMSLSGRLIGDDGVANLLAALQGSGGYRFLTSLSLDGNGISHRGGVMVAKYLEGRCGSSVALGSNFVNDESKGPMRSSSPALKFLHLDWNRVEESGAVAIGRALATNDNLKELFLGRNKIGDVGATAIAVGILKRRERGRSGGVVNLSLMGNNIGPVGMSAIADCLGPLYGADNDASPSSLERLHLGDNRAAGTERGRGMHRLISSLETNGRLSYLSLWRCSIAASHEEKLLALTERRGAVEGVKPLKIYLDRNVGLDASTTAVENQTPTWNEALAVGKRGKPMNERTLLEATEGQSERDQLSRVGNTSLAETRTLPSLSNFSGIETFAAGDSKADTFDEQSTAASLSTFPVDSETQTLGTLSKVGETNFDNLSKVAPTDFDTQSKAESTEVDAPSKGLKSVDKLEFTDAHWGVGLYDGEVGASGTPHGRGKFTSVKQDKTYSGEWSDGARTGWGHAIWKTEESQQYRGFWRDGLRDGRGVNTFDDGKSYDGEFKNGLRHGYGKQENKDDTIYDGEWQNDLRHGHGMLRTSQGRVIYEGDWLCNQREKSQRSSGRSVGRAMVAAAAAGRRAVRRKRNSLVEVDADQFSVTEMSDLVGDTISLQRAENMKWTDSYWGFGVYTGPLDSESRPHGKGRFSSEQGNEYEGDFFAGERTGFGTAKWSKGSVYKGNWKFGRRHGFGTIEKVTGLKYVGNWREGERHGMGEEFVPGQIPKHGEWNYGSFLRRTRKIGGSSLHGTEAEEEEEEEEKVAVIPISVRDAMWGDGKYGGEIDEHTKKPSGYGDFEAIDGRWYDGEWRDGCRHGHGVAGWPMNGIEYDGDWVEGKRHGIGSATWLDGTRYLGEWKENQRDGTGVFIGPNGTFWRGTWKNDEMTMYG